MTIYQTLYVSSAAKEIDSNAIQSIVATANRYNAKHDITGILLFRAGVFLQFLEGEKSQVEALFEKNQIRSSALKHHPYL